MPGDGGTLQIERKGTRAFPVPAARNTYLRTVRPSLQICRMSWRRSTLKRPRNCSSATIAAVAASSRNAATRAAHGAGNTPKEDNDEERNACRAADPRLKELRIFASGLPRQEAA